MSHSISALIAVFCATCCIAAPAPDIRAETPALPPPALPSGVIDGAVRDSATGKPVASARIVIQELKRGTTSHANGTFHLLNVPVGTWNVVVSAMGYDIYRVRVSVSEGDTAEVSVQLAAGRYKTADVVVEGLAHHHPPAAVALSESDLNRRQGRTVAEMLDAEPGISQRSMGSAPSRPVIRGMSGERLLIVEDGQRMGDLSASSSDHAVALDPLSAHSIEVIRGPRTLLYSSSPLGGVVDVVRGLIPQEADPHVSGRIRLGGETVNTGGSADAELTAPLGPLSLRAAGTYRATDNTRTPLGILQNTAVDTRSLSLGAGHTAKSLTLGAGGSAYYSRYGIPPDPFGGHPRGVSIEMERFRGEARARWIFGSSGEDPDFLTVHYTGTQYRHSEFESSGALGAAFGVQTHTAEARYDVGENTSVLAYGEYRDAISTGLTFTPSTRSAGGTAAIYHRQQAGSVSLEGALRAEYRSHSPEAVRPTEAGAVRFRSFAGFSAAVTARLPLTESFGLSAMVARGWRAPTADELFSAGPHLAAYSYDVGNAELPAEVSHGIEISASHVSPTAEIRTSFWGQVYDGFLQPVSTGRPSARRADLIVFRTDGIAAMLFGGEVDARLAITDDVETRLSASYVRGTRRGADSASNLSLIPPLEGRMSARWHNNTAAAAIGIHWAAAQGHVGQFEKTTAGWATVSVSAEYRLSSPYGVFLFILSADNIFDTVYRRHLNRVKDVMPEAGRNIRLSTSFYW